MDLINGPNMNHLFIFNLEVVHVYMDGRDGLGAWTTPDSTTSDFYPNLLYIFSFFKFLNSKFLIF